MNKVKIQKHKLLLRHLSLDDYDNIAVLMEHVYGNLGGAWKQDQYASQVTRFPEGQILIEDNGQLVAAALSMVVDYARFGDVHTYAQITGDGYLTHHDPMGDTLYGVDIFVHPNYRGQRLGRRLYDASKELCRNLNLSRFIVGGRIPGYAQYADTLTPVRYIEEVKNREIFDPVLTFQLVNGFHVRKVLTGYLPVDEDSKGYATLLEWVNLDYVDKLPSIGGPKSVIRLKVFDTDCGKIAVLICYDSEFPELARLATFQGAQVLFVPFWTDTKNACQRVRYCSQARAIENECFVAITGSVGNLPYAENMDIQYAQAAIFSPSDFSFPHDTILAEATPNTEMTLIADVNLDLLKQVRTRGATRNLANRRTDLYRLEWV